jgi:hypothetical protein
MGSEALTDQEFFYGMIFLAVLMAGIAIFGFTKPKLRYSLLISFIGCWGFTFFLIPLTAYFRSYSDIFKFHGPLIRWMELSVTVFWIIAFIFILVPLVFSIIGAVKLKQPGGKEMFILGLLSFFVALVLMGTYIPSTQLSPSRSAEAEVKTGLHVIQVAVERYAFDHEGHYPREISDLIGTNYLYSYPQNPFSAEPMKPVEFGASGFEGNFTYVPVIQAGEVRGFYLLAYGAESNGAQDVDEDGKRDHVLLVLSDETNASEPELSTLLSVSQPEI